MENKIIAIGVGSSWLFTIALIILKLFGAISWDWLWVISPMLICSILVTVYCAIAIIVIAILRQVI